MAHEARYRWSGYSEPRKKQLLPVERVMSGPFGRATGKQVQLVTKLRRKKGIPVSGDSTRPPVEALSVVGAKAEIERLLSR